MLSLSRFAGNRLLASTLGLVLTAATSAPAQTPNEGAIGGGASCEPEYDVIAERGELFALKVTGEDGYEDWILHMRTKGGAVVGMGNSDIGGGPVGDNENVYLVLTGNYREVEAPSDVVTIFATFPAGRVAIDSGELSSGYNWMAGTTQQTVGNSHPFAELTAGIVLPDERSGYDVALPSGVERFPRPLSDGWEVAFSPLLDLFDDAGLLPEMDYWDTFGGCRLAGSRGDVGPDRTPLGWGLIAGYNVYRWPVDEGGAGPDVLASLEHFVYFIPIRPDLSVPDDLHEIVDPDGQRSSGDEVVLFRDASANPDGSPREIGEAPQSGRNYWYAFQPVAMGDLGGWDGLDFIQRHGETNEILESRTADWRTDLDGDGLFDSITIPRQEPPDEGSGPTFFSPQAEWGLPGLGLTHDGLPLLSPVVHSAGDQGDEDCTNGADDDGDGLADCEDGDCASHPDCADAGGGIRIEVPGGDPELVVGWDETLGESGVLLSRGELDVLWREERVAHGLIGCDLLGRQAVVDDPGGDLFFLAAAVPEGGSSPDFGSDSQGQRRSAAQGECP